MKTFFLSATVGVDYDSRIMEHDGKFVKVHLHDISGQESFLWLAKKQITEADGFIFVYDVTDRNSFLAVKRWLNLVDKCAKADKLPKILVGNKCDARNKHEVPCSEAKEFAIPEGMRQLECSAKTGKNLNVIFYILAGEILRFRKLGCIMPIANPDYSRNTHIAQVHEDPELVTKLVDNGPDYSHLFKILLVGGQRVGKTAFRFRFCRDHYSPEYFASAGLDFSTRTLMLDGDKVKVQIWDVSGDDIYDSTRKSYYKGANAFIIMYDIGSMETFQQAERLLKELDMYGQSDSPKVVVGNKGDCAGKRKVGLIEAREWADGWRLPLIETSARTGDNVDGAVVKLVMALKKQMAPWKRLYDFS